jgi:tRNA1(Val) A37 N6-methylase TrmN6
VGELLASLGCGDWRMYQLANGHKLTVDDFICAWVAAEEMRNRGYGVATGNFGQTVVNGDDKHRSKTFRHADIGCGCGSVLMTLAWAFPNTIQSHGVEAQQVSFQLCQRGLLWNLGVDGSSASEHRVRVSHQDLRSWDGGDEDQAPYDLITGTPPYFPQDRFVASENHSQKIRCRVPTRGAAAEYVQAAARLLASDGIFVMVETARKEGEQAVLETATSCKLQVIRRLDIVTKTGLPPRFSCWVMRRRQAQDDENSQQLFNIETFTLRNVDQMRALEYVEAMEKMGWIDFENTRQKLGKKAAT